MNPASDNSPPIIPRHKTAIRRPGLSLPVKCLLRDGLLDVSRSLFDYGCGHGQDLELLGDLGVPASGWDPVFRSDSERSEAEMVNLGYVINVIEDPQERDEALRSAWGLCRSVMVVAALGTNDGSGGAGDAFSDGVLTSRGTFQKRYGHQELRAYLSAKIAVEPVPAAPNVFYLFRSEEERERFVASRFRRLVAVPRRRVSDLLYEQNREILDAFVESLAALGRLPGPDELPQHGAIVETFGSLKRAFQVVRHATGQQAWTDIAARRREDLLVYLAMARFGRKRPLSKLPLSMQRDIRAFVGSYSEAQEQANAILFSVGNPDNIDRACQEATIGCLVDNALILRRESLAELAPILRVFEGCARAILGEVEGANVVKLHRFSGKVTYLVSPDLDDSPEPSVVLRVKVELPALDIRVFDYGDYVDMPRLGVDPSLLGRRSAEAVDDAVLPTQAVPDE